MDKFTSIAGALIADELGVTAIEYGLIGALLVVGAIVGFTAFGTAISELYEYWVAAAVEAATP